MAVETASTGPAVPGWPRVLAQAIRDPAVLLDRLALPARLLPGARRAAALFPLRVPEPYLARIRPGDADDPLLRQVLPLDAEGRFARGYVADPLAEAAATVAPGLLHKYAGRALLVTTGACAIHCRYCFRRHFPYGESYAGGPWLAGALAALRADPSLHEVILSGGDPLTMRDERLAALVARLEQISHLRTLRIHTRLPIVVPQRVDTALCAWLARTRLRTVVVVHANHARELDGEVIGAARRLREAGATLLNQAVLLRGVNDSAPALAALSERLLDAGILPYYLHLPDRVSGTAHFAVGAGRARALIAALRAALPGYLVPRLVREVPGLASKKPIA
jgi:L-lysine 2,3-aminomutase